MINSSSLKYCPKSQHTTVVTGTDALDVQDNSFGGIHFFSLTNPIVAPGDSQQPIEQMMILTNFGTININLKQKQFYQN